MKYAEKFTELNLPVALKEIDTIEKATRILDKISLTDEEREIYEARLKALRDENGALETARIKGLEEGRKEGKKEGIEEGIKKGIEEGIKKGEIKGERKNAIETAKKSLIKGLSEELISELTGLSAEEIRSLKNG